MKRTVWLLVLLLSLFIPSSVSAQKKEEEKNPRRTIIPVSSASPTSEPDTAVSPAPSPTESVSPSPKPSGKVSPTPSPEEISPTQMPSPTAAPLPETKKEVTPTSVPEEHPKSNPTATPTPTQSEPAVLSIKDEPPTEEPQADEKENTIQKNISSVVKAPFDFVARALPKDYYASEKLSKNTTYELLTTALVLFFTGVILLRPLPRFARRHIRKYNWNNIKLSFPFYLRQERI